MCQRLQTVIDRQQFDIVIQAKVGSKVRRNEGSGGGSGGGSIVVIVAVGN